MGIMLYPNDGDVPGLDVSWSYSGFHMFRQWLAEAEGFVLTKMHGYGGDRPWTGVSSTLTPLLHHPDDGGPDLTPAQCAAMLPRLEEIARRPPAGDGPDVLGGRVEDLRRLVAVLRRCLGKDVGLGFG